MKPLSLVDQLAEIERHIREGERHLSHQREIVDELERHGRGKSQKTKIARQILGHLKPRNQAISIIGGLDV